MKEQITLSKLQMLIRDSIMISMPESYWVSAEIGELKVNYSGHCYLELIEKSSTGDSIRARVRATIWAARYRTLRPFFETTTGETLREGITVLVRVTVEYHELYGLSLNLNDIDPAYTLGDIALKRQEIIRRLTAEGVIDMNREVPMPMLPKRVAVISSATAAGYEDFKNQLLNNPNGYGYFTELFSSPMQGRETARGIIAALDRIALRANEFDLVVILRGGGSSTDLQWFDNYEASFHITQFPLPVVTGIGHEKDISVIDMVAWKSLKTPTAVAAFLLQLTGDTDSIISEYKLRIRQAVASIIREGNSITTEAARKIMPLTVRITGTSAKKINSLGLALSSASLNRIRDAGISLAIKKTSLKSVSTQSTAREKNSLPERIRRLKRASSDSLRSNKEKIAAAENLLKVARPENILRKGFTLTTLNGKTIYTINSISEGDIITTRFADGSSYSRVERKESN